jgi:hypothetical protein
MIIAAIEIIPNNFVVFFMSNLFLNRVSDALYGFAVYLVNRTVPQRGNECSLFSFGQIYPLVEGAGEKDVFLKSFFYKGERERERERFR